MDVSVIDRACAAVGGASTLAELLGIKPPSVSEWKTRGRVPAERVLEIERVTKGAVSRHELRPDLYPREPVKRGPISLSA
jgi:DNA-binding transcriptional regulator YdaS (Cro superfamily)